MTTCPTCNGSKFVTANDPTIPAPLTVEQLCPTCNGKGKAPAAFQDWVTLRVCYCGDEIRVISFSTPSAARTAADALLPLLPRGWSYTIEVSTPTRHNSYDTKIDWQGLGTRDNTAAFRRGFFAGRSEVASLSDTSLAAMRSAMETNERDNFPRHHADDADMIRGRLTAYRLFA